MIASFLMSEISALKVQYSAQKSGSDGIRHSHKYISYRRGRETKFPTKFFAKLSFKKAVGAEAKRSFAEGFFATFFLKKS